MSKNNPFSLYQDDMEVTSNMVEKRFKTLWKRFVKDWNTLQNKYAYVGASDSAAREAQVKWIKKHAEDIW